MKARLILAAVAATALAASAHEVGPRYPFAKGTIEKVDLAGRKLILDGPRVFSVTDRAYFFRGKEKLSFEKLKIGDAIKMNYYTNETGQAFIRRLKIDLLEPALP